MSRLMVFFLLQTILSAVMWSQQVHATDGDVDYSAPYITVDPETGQLVTRNPGPRLKAHPMEMPDPSAGQSAMISAAPSEEAISAGQSDSEQAGQDGYTGEMVVALFVGLLVFGTLAVRRFLQRQS